MLKAAPAGENNIKGIRMKCLNLRCPICYGEGETDAGDAMQRLRIVSQEGVAAAYIPYEIILADGIRLTGATDGGGYTENVKRGESVYVRHLTLSPSSYLRRISCSAIKPIAFGTEDIYTSHEGGTKTSVPVLEVKVKKGGKRRLTHREIMMAQKVFGNGVDYATVWVHRGGWWLFMGMQRPDTAVTPNGEMYYPDAIYQYDFGDPAIDISYQALFIHEMTHVWQYQMGYPVKRKGMTVTIHGKSIYKYNLTKKSRLCDFNMEQQGNIISDYYMICVKRDIDNAYNSRVDSDLLYSVMDPFLRSPRDKQHLPKEGL